MPPPGKQDYPPLSSTKTNGAQNSGWVLLNKVTLILESTTR